MKAHRRKAVPETVCGSLYLSNTGKFFLSIRPRVTQERIKFSVSHREDAIHKTQKHENLGGKKRGFFLKMLLEENKFELLVLKKNQITIISTNVI